MLLSQVADGVLSLTLNRPEKRNALDSGTISALTAALQQAELDPAVRAVAIRGAGKDFCAGADLDELLASADKAPEENEKAAAKLGEVFSVIRRVPKPVVAVVQGRALAGGAGLATACDLVVAASSSQFGYPEIQRGFVPAMVMTMLRRVAGEKRAFDLVATGRLITANEALDIGLDLSSGSRCRPRIDRHRAGRPAGLLQCLGDGADQAAVLPAGWPPVRRWHCPGSGSPTGCQSTVCLPLHQALRDWRRSVADGMGVPDYTVLPDVVLERIAALRPRDRDGLRVIEGLGRRALAKWERPSSA